MVWPEVTGKGLNEKASIIALGMGIDRNFGWNI
jgi:hypothetical protein